MPLAFASQTNLVYFDTLKAQIIKIDKNSQQRPILIAKINLDTDKFALGDDGKQASLAVGADNTIK